MDPNTVDPVENRRRMLAGELYYAFTPDLTADRQSCKSACKAYNMLCTSGEPSRRELVTVWKTYVAIYPIRNFNHPPLKPVTAWSTTPRPSHRRPPPPKKTTRSSATTPGSTARSSSTTASTASMSCHIPQHPSLPYLGSCSHQWP
jgi:hypothetical protein